jgi:hypothetical protein
MLRCQALLFALNGWIMTEQQLLFDKLAYIDRLTRAGIGEREARAHAEAMEEALRESVATKIDLARLRTDLEHKVEIAVRDLTIRTGAMLIVLFSALAPVKFFGSAG